MFRYLNPAEIRELDPVDAFVARIRKSAYSELYLVELEEGSTFEKSFVSALPIPERSPFPSPSNV